jgi:hypothetical protein
MSEPHARPDQPPRYVVLAALLLLAAALTAAVRPDWFVAPTGRVAVFGGPTGALLLAAALWWRSRLAYALTVLGALAWATVSVARLQAGGVPAAHVGLAVGMSAVVALLLVPAGARRYFFAHSD